MKTDPQNKTILVIDNDLDSRTLLFALFKNTNYPLLCVNSNIEDVKSLNLPIDLIFIEFYSTFCNYNLIKEVRSLKPKIPLVALTVCAMNEEKAMSIKYGCDYYISKPFNTKQLLSFTNHILQKQTVLV